MHAPHQFSLRELFLATLIVAVACWFLFYLPHPLWVILLWMIALSTLVSAVVYADGRARAFAVGCAPPVLWWVAATRGALYQEGAQIETLLAMAVITVLSGCVSICVRNWSVRQREQADAEELGERTKASPEPRAMEAEREVVHARSATESIDEDVFDFIEGTKKYWTCPSCHNTFISLQVHPACPTCGSLSVIERPRTGKVRYGMSMAVRT